jgi:hypothetical protein
MEYNLAGIRQRVLVDKLDDDEFDTAIIDRFINDTQRDIFNQYELSFQEKIFAGTLPATSVMFALPDDLSQLQSAVITTPDNKITDIMSKYIDFRTFNRLFPKPSITDAGEVQFWSMYAGNMLLSRPTDIDYELTIFYTKKPTLLALDTDVPEIPEEFAELLVLGAYIRCLERNEDYDLAAYAKVEYNNMLDMLVAKYGFRKANGPIKMKNKQMTVRKR